VGMLESRHRDLAGLGRTMAECRSGGVNLDDGDFLEMIFVLSEAGHKEHVVKILTMTHPEAEEFSGMAAHLVVRMVNAGHVVMAEFLGQIVKLGHPREPVHCPRKH